VKAEQDRNITQVVWSDQPDLHQIQALQVAKPGSQVLCLDLRETDIEDGMIMAALTAQLRKILLQEVDIELQSPPQLLLHNLYRVACYPHPRLRVIDPRPDEEAYG